MAKPEESQQVIAGLIRARRTIHTFRGEIPSDRIIEQALELACWAPNHKLTEPWRFYLLGRETSQQIVELNADLIATEKGDAAATSQREKWSAIPGWLVVTSERSVEALQDKENYAAVCCAVQNLSLFLWSHGIGMKWTTGPVTRHPGIYEILNLDPQQAGIVGVFWYGYPAETPTMKRHSATDYTVRLP